MLSQSSSGLKVASGGFLSNFHLIRALKVNGYTLCGESLTTYDASDKESKHSVLIVGQFHKKDLEKEGLEYKTKTMYGRRQSVPSLGYSECVLITDWISSDHCWRVDTKLNPILSNTKVSK